MRKLPFFAALVALVAVTGAPATSQATRSAVASVVISTRTLPKLGTVLVNSKGRTLYLSLIHI